jgi:hypothetical protein
MTPTAVTLKELEFLKNGYEELYAKTDPKKN